MLEAFFGLVAPLLLAAMGGLLSERSGVMNIALEGKMLVAACAAALVGVASGVPILGLFAGLVAAVGLSLLHGWLAQAFRLDHIVSGMGVNAIALGGTTFLFARFNDNSRAGEIPALPEAFYWVLSVAVVAALGWILKNTKSGLRLMATGNDPAKAREIGLQPERIRYFALVGCGLLCGLAGVLIVTKTGRFSDEMTAGKGYIALAALVVGGWRPWATLVACFVFAALETAQIQLQGGASWLSGISSEYWNAMPYLITVLALALVGGKAKSPAGLGKP